MQNPFDIGFKPFITNVLLNDLETFKRDYSSETLFKDLNLGFDNGDICFRTVPNRTAIQHLLRSSRIVQSNREIPAIRPQHFTDLFKAVTHSITNIKAAGNLSTCLTSAYKIRNALGGKLYGLLLIDGDVIINPFHPLTAMSLLSDKKLTDKHKNFRMAIYTYPSQEVKDNLYEVYGEAHASEETIITNINNQILTFANKVDTEIEVQSTDANSTSNLTIKYRIKKHADEEDDAEYYVTAQQIFTLGIVMPYYGTSIIRMGQSTGGIPVTPMWSCNIATRAPGESRWENHKTPADKVSIPFDSVCTGNLPNNSLTGLRTLTHSNASSPHITEIICPGSLTYASMCIDKSIEIYLKSKLISE